MSFNYCLVFSAIIAIPLSFVTTRFCRLESDNAARLDDDKMMTTAMERRGGLMMRMIRRKRKGPQQRKNLCFIYLNETLIALVALAREDTPAVMVGRMYGIGSVHSADGACVLLESLETAHSKVRYGRLIVHTHGHQPVTRRDARTDVEEVFDFRVSFHCRFARDSIRTEEAGV